MCFEAYELTARLCEIRRMRPMATLDGKVAVITGASSGIGEAAALLFGREGAKVVVAARREDKGQAVVSQVQ